MFRSFSAEKIVFSMKGYGKMQEFLSILQRALAEESQAQRLYAAMLLLAPSEEDKTQLLEIFKDESDHAVLIEDMLVKYTTGEPGQVALNVGGVE